MPGDDKRRTSSWDDSRFLARRAARLGIVAWLLAVLVFVAALVVAVPPARLAARTLLLLPSFFVGVPHGPFNLFSPEPVHEVVELPQVDGFVRAHVYRPPSGRHAALVLSLGVDPAPPDDPRVVSLLSGLARAGLTAILIQSEALDNDRLLPDVPRALVEAVQFASSRPYVRPDRVGLFGFSVGGSLALVAASQPEIRDRLRLVDAFGGYADLQDALLSVLSQTLDDGRTIRRWKPDPRAVQHLANGLIGSLAEDPAADSLRRRFVDGDGSVAIDAGSLSPQAEAVYEALTTTDREKVRMVLSRLVSVQANEAALSPLPVLGQIRARLFIMYDRDDPLLPFTGSRTLCRAAQIEGLHPYCSSFAIFQHVDPTRGGNALTVSHDVVELYFHALAVLRRLE